MDSHNVGTRVIAEIIDKPIVLIYAHLARSVLCHEGDKVKPGEIFGKIGKSSENGHWFPHLHVQAVNSTYYHRLKPSEFANLDGYGMTEEIRSLPSMFPDPIKYICLH